jgi:nitrite reductase/ring-hydroxylating ferredoxin subunit
MGEFIKVAKTSEIMPGTGKYVEAQGCAIALFNLDGDYYAIGNACTHRGGPLAEGFIAGDEVTCPWHGARFKIPTAEALSPPAPKGVPRYNVRVEGDEIEVEV